KLHSRVASVLQTVYADSRDEYAATISEHYEEAGELAQAAEWYTRAGHHARASYTPIAAIEAYQKALHLWPELEAKKTSEALHEQRFEIYEGLGEMLVWQTRYAEATDVFTAMRADAEAVKNVVVQARGWLGASKAQIYRGDIHAAQESAAHAEEIARGA